MLTVVKRFQGASPEERTAFLNTPHVFLKEALAGTPDEQLVDEVLEETAEYSERVKAIGIRVPKVLPFIKPGAQQWLPPEDGGLRIDDALVRIAPRDVAALIARVEDAIRASAPFVEHRGEQIPASAETLAALRQLEAAYSSGAATTPKESAERGEPLPRMALLVHDNLETLEYVPQRRRARDVATTAPMGLMTGLYEHQRIGFDWLRVRWCDGWRGGLLADDMGLGKTLQALAFLAWVKTQAGESEQRKPILIVAPTGLLKNWQKEMDTHLSPPGLGEVLAAHGSGLSGVKRAGLSASTEQMKGVPVLDEELLQRADVVLTTYETLRDYQLSFARVKWEVMVLDEAQKIKNPAALMSEAVKGMNAEFVLALTGTPVETTLQDLWSIVDTIEPGKLGALKPFLAEYEPTSEVSEAPAARLKSRLLEEEQPPLMLRRMKVDHLTGLPEIRVVTDRRPMPRIQADAYESVVSGARHRVANQSGMLQVLQDLRMVSLCPHMDSAPAGPEFFQHSARLQVLVEVLERVSAKGEKALVFLESRQMQGLLTLQLQRHFQLHRPPLIINGEVPGGERQRRVEEFQARRGFDVMLLSPRAGGVGITLTAANHVIHLARWWNPAVEDQCTDRVYRIGQSKPVTVHLPIAVHPRFQKASFDERLHALLEQRRDLSHAVLAPVGDRPGDVKQLFSDTTDVR